MKRWNGWGTENTPYHLPPTAEQFLNSVIGEGLKLEDARLADVVAKVPASRLPAHPLVNTDAEVRLRHARGHSMQDWIDLNAGQIPVFPDGVAFPTSDDEVRQLLAYAKSTGARLIPYGGGTSVVGHINPLPGDAPVLTVALTRMNALEDLDVVSNIATLGAGARGPEVEDALNQRGFTLGHFPQSWEYSTVGGWVASRSVGTQCYYYGRIEDLFIGGHMETPTGSMDLPLVPASAAGPDLRHLVMGSEGRAGIITRASMRVTPLPQKEAFYAVFYPNWEEGRNALREIVQNRIPLSMLRLLNPAETETYLQLSGKPDFVKVAHSGLNLIGIRDERCMMLYGVTGTAATCRSGHAQVLSVARSHSGFPVDFIIGGMWHKTRFTTPYLRNTLWEKGIAIDTLETALPWSKTEPAATEIQKAIVDAFASFGERAHVFAHLSHMYTDGASLYITYIFRRAATPQETFTRWQAAKAAASQKLVEHGGTISHQHGVGTDHAPYLKYEKGELGMRILKDVFADFDPDGMMNPGKLLI